MVALRKENFNDDGNNVEDDNDLVHIAGTIKWYDPAKGFGFVMPHEDIAEHFDSDILLHKTVLNAFGYKDADESVAVKGMARQTEKGWQLIEIIELPPPVSQTISRLMPDKLDLETVFVKWFDEELGYGFVHRYGEEEDIFLHAVCLKKQNITELYPSQPIQAVICQGPKGQHVKYVFAEPVEE